MNAIELPWPASPLWPNRKAHWAVARKARFEAKKAAVVLCWEAKAPKGAASLTVTMHPPRKPGLMNVDGCIAALKAHVDGIALALGVDDSELRISWPETFGEPVKGGCVRVTITPIEEDLTAMGIEVTG